MCTIKMMWMNGLYKRSLKWPVPWCFTHIFSGKNGIRSKLWPMANSYSNYILNQMLNAEYIAPDYLFNGTKFPCNKLKYIHVWGCTVYVLDPTLQQGRKLPKWQQQSHCRIFVGSSQNHSSNFPLILNQATGHISQQFNVIFDDYFSTALSFSLE